MSPSDDVRLAAEQRARVLIDAQLAAAGWVVQDKADLNLFAADGVAVREVVMATGHGRADYLLYVDQRAVGVVEAKPAGSTLSGVEWQSAMYAEGLPAAVRLKALTVDGRLPFLFEASGTETHFTNGYDPDPRARRLFHFPRRATLARILRDAVAEPDAATWRARIRTIPPLNHAPMRPAQITAIEGIERSLAEQRFDRGLVQMATGAGKTFTAVTEAYRLLKHGGFIRILFIVDRNNLAEFQNYRSPGDGRRFTEIYNVDKLTSTGMLGSSSVRSPRSSACSRCSATRTSRPETIPDVGVRPADQPALHPQAEPAPPAPPRRVRRGLPARKGSKRAGRVRAVEVVHARRARRARQGQPRTSPGCATSRWKTSTTCPHLRSSPARSWRISPLRWSSSRRSLRHWRLESPKTEAARELGSAPSMTPKPTNAHLTRLSGPECALFGDRVGARWGDGVRLGQERIDWGWVTHRLPPS